jgi:ribosomal protein S18 acetylase RimI-like enzyme
VTRQQLATAGIRGWYATFASAGSTVATFGSAQAMRTMLRPERSLLNAAVYDDPSDVPLDELAAFFEPVAAWCLWVQPGHEDLVATCEARGMVIDGTPMMMAAELAAVDITRRDVPAEIGPATWADMAAINELAYGMPADHFGVVLRQLSTDGYHLAVARRDGVPLACSGVHVTDTNAHVVFVATLPTARRQGLAAECMRTVLRAAAADGCTTTTLEASGAGEPIYVAMGYDPIGRYRMMEARRTAADS